MITIIYYTSNKEDVLFEETIQRYLLQTTNGTPIISVSQEPINLGENICVGEIGVSDRNILYQLLVGCEAARTNFIATAESDFLYPPKGYFDFQPEDEQTIYHYTNLWVLDKTRNHFRKKQFSLGAQICGREYLISRLKAKLSMKIPRGDITKAGWKGFESEIPCITIKTGDGMRSHCGTSREVKPQISLPYWGEIEKVKRIFWCQ